MVRLRFKTVEIYIALLRNNNLTIKLNEIEKRRRDTGSTLGYPGRDMERERESLNEMRKKQQVFIVGRLEGLPRHESDMFTR